MRAEGVAAVILAGGRARRFGGEDKGLIALAGRPLAAHVAQRLAGQVDEILISANRNIERYAELGYPVVADGLPDHPGPLAGILAAAAHTRAEWLLTAPCDAPFLPLDLAARLLAEAKRQGVRLARAADAERGHFAVMLLHRSLLPDLEATLRAGERKVQAWQARHARADVVFNTDARAFFNVNTPEDLREAEAICRAEPSSG